MAHPTISKQVKLIRKYIMDRSTPLNKTDVPVLDDRVYGMKVAKYMVKYKEVRANKIAWVNSMQISTIFVCNTAPHICSRC